MPPKSVNWMALGKAEGEKHLEQVEQEFLTSPAPPPKFFT